MKHLCTNEIARPLIRGIEKLFVVLVAFSVPQVVCAAGFVDGKDLKAGIAQYKKNKNSFSSGFFAGFVAGVADTGDTVLFCIPESLSGGSLSDVVIDYLAKHKVRDDEGAFNPVVKAFVQAFPCEKSRYRF